MTDGLRKKDCFDGVGNKDGFGVVDLSFLLLLRQSLTIEEGGVGASTERDPGVLGSGCIVMARRRHMGVGTRVQT